METQTGITLQGRRPKADGANKIPGPGSPAGITCSHNLLRACSFKTAVFFNSAAILCSNDWKMDGAGTKISEHKFTCKILQLIY